MGWRSRLLALAVCLVCLGHAHAGELSSEEKRWAKDCIKRVSANSPRVREGAEKALVALGLDGLPLLVEAWSQLDGRAERASLKRIFRGLGPEKVARALQEMRTKARGRDAKRLDALLRSLAPRAPSSAVLRVPLMSTTELAWREVPLGVEHEVGDTLPRGLGLGMRRVRRTTDSLVVDVDGDGVPEVDVLQAGARVVLFRTDQRLRPLLIYAKLGTWYACSASLLQGMLDDRRVRVLDGNLDGAFGGAGDFVQVGDGSFVPIEAPHLLLWGDALARYEVHVGERGAELRLSMLAPLAGLDPSTRRGHVVLNGFRQAIGLQPLRYDAERSKGCREHAEYLAINLGKGADALAKVDAHAQDRNARGYTPKGAEAAGLSNVGPGALPEAIERITRTMLHRVRWLCAATETAGLGATRRGRGWSVIWTGPGRASGDVPVVVPAPGQEDVPLEISRERPLPDAAPSFYDKKRGYPISATYEPLPLTDVRLTLLEADGATPLPGRLFTPQVPVASSAAGNGGSAFFVPDQPLRASRTYWVLFTARREGRAIRHAWSFQTR